MVEMWRGIMLLCVPVMMAGMQSGCVQKGASMRILQNQAQRMFNGYGAWSSDCLHLLSREEVHCESDIVVLENRWNNDEPKIEFHPSKDGRIVVFDDPPNRHNPQAVTPCEIIFVDISWKYWTVLYHGPNRLGVFLQTNDKKRTCTWIEFPCRSGEKNWTPGDTRGQAIR